MKLILTSSVFVVMGIIGLILLMYIVKSNTVVVRYDCRQLIGGWHPDLPVAVQEACRSRRNDADSKTSN